VREQKQAEYESLTETLQHTMAEKEKAHIPGRSASIGGFFKAKLDDFKGVDPEHARIERIARLERRILEVHSFVFFVVVSVHYQSNPAL
jgi:sorting nexin-4